MRMDSVFCAECICGFHFETPAREFTCPKCDRVIVLEWGVADSDRSSRADGKSVDLEAAA